MGLLCQYNDPMKWWYVRWVGFWGRFAYIQVKGLLVNNNNNNNNTNTSTSTSSSSSTSTSSSSSTNTNTSSSSSSSTNTNTSTSSSSSSRRRRRRSSSSSYPRALPTANSIHFGFTCSHAVRASSHWCAFFQIFWRKAGRFVVGEAMVGILHLKFAADMNSPWGVNINV